MSSPAEHIPMQVTNYGYAVENPWSTRMTSSTSNPEEAADRIEVERSLINLEEEVIGKSGWHWYDRAALISRELAGAQSSNFIVQYKCV